VKKTSCIILKESGVYILHAFHGGMDWWIRYVLSLKLKTKKATLASNNSTVNTHTKHKWQMVASTSKLNHKNMSVHLELHKAKSDLFN